MKKLLILLTIFCNLHAVSYANDIALLRELFFNSANDLKSAEELSALLLKINPQDQPILVAYKGMSNIMLSKHAFNPFEKLKLFNSGRTLLETAIQKDPYLIELRFLRFTVQTNAPFFLNYSENISEDKRAVLDGVMQLKDEVVRKYMVNYLLKCNDCTASEKQKLIL